MSFPAGIAFGPDGKMYFTERDGRVRVTTAEGRLQPDPIVELPTSTSGETGALGIDVGGENNDSLYVFVTDPDGGNDVVRVDIASHEVSVVVDGIPGSGYHNGGGVVWHEGSLFVSNGETHESARSQEPDELGGKVYRFESDGSVPADNPFGSSPTFALGLRNPYGMALDPVSGDLFVTENGPHSHDEVNHIEAGGNYGWPDVSGPAGDADTSQLAGEYHEPVLDYPDIIVPTGIAFADPDEALPEYSGHLFFGSFGEGALHDVELDESRSRALSDDVVVEEDNGIVAVAWGPGGIYYSTPSSIKLLPIAAEASPIAEASPEEEGGFRVGAILIVLAVAAVIAALLVVINRRVSGPPDK